MTVLEIILSIIVGIIIPLVIYIWHQKTGEIRELREWKKDIMENQGGFVTGHEHKRTCDEVGDGFVEKLDDKLKAAVLEIKLYIYRGFLEGRFKPPEKE